MITNRHPITHRKKVVISVLMIVLIGLVEATIFLINGFIVGFYEINQSENIDNISDFINVSINLLIIYLFCKRLSIRMPLRKVSNYRYYFYAIILCFLIILLNNYLEYKLLDLFPFLSSLNSFKYSKEDVYNVHSIIFLGVLYPLVEELSFRGILYKVIREEKSFIFSATFVSLLFFLFHPAPQAFILFFGMSFVLCYLFENYNSIVPPLLFHSLYNVLMIIHLSYF